MYEGASAARAGGQRTGGKDQLYCWQGQTSRLQSFRFAEDSPGDRHLPYTVSPPYTLSYTILCKICRHAGDIIELSIGSTLLVPKRGIPRKLGVF